MSELHPLDWGFMELENADPHVSLGIGAVAIMTGPAPSRAGFAGWLRERVDRYARLRQRVRRIPLDLTAPVWEDDPDFDLAHHLRWTALPEPGDEPALRELIATELEQRLDRDYPLWQCVVVERLAGGRWALLVKAHHSMVDGISGITLFEQLCVPPPTTGAAPANDPGMGSSGGGLVDRVRRGIRLPVTAPRFAVSLLRSLVPVMAAAITPGAPSSLNGPIGRQRRYVVSRVSMAEVAAIDAAFGTTVNDVALAAVTAAYRSVLRARGEEPNASKLRILVPVSMRATGAESTMDNRVSAILPFLPVDLDDPVERLAAVHDRVAHHRVRGEAEAERSILAMADVLPFAIGAWAFRLAGHFPQRSVAALATNVPGPRDQLIVDGCPVLEIWPCIPLAMRLRTTIAILSYRDHLTFGITGDYDSTPDLDLIAAGIEHGIAELLALAR
ncbi:wax ester/triacylglycerol synthase family O-acyltransferase [Nocardia rhizosphaerae]|uniref:Diacylglycerol O-acyltransferase n=1 Tax=Nocardia rhizosphaerae TaxID=1691571 RepID=A0ABV8LAP1_9NOCA